MGSAGLSRELIRGPTARRRETRAGGEGWGAGRERVSVGITTVGRSERRGAQGRQRSQQGLGQVSGGYQGVLTASPSQGSVRAL